MPRNGRSNEEIVHALHQVDSGERWPRSAGGRHFSARRAPPKELANCSGVAPCNALCGRTVLSSMRHASMSARASATRANQCSLRHSSLNLH